MIKIDVLLICVFLPIIFGSGLYFLQNRIKGFFFKLTVGILYILTSIISYPIIFSNYYATNWLHSYFSPCLFLISTGIIIVLFIKTNTFKKYLLLFSTLFLLNFIWCLILIQINRPNDSQPKPLLIVDNFEVYKFWDTPPRSAYVLYESKINGIIHKRIDIEPGYDTATQIIFESKKSDVYYVFDQKNMTLKELTISQMKTIKNKSIQH